MIIDCAAYRRGVREDVSPDPAAILEALQSLGDDDFLWIGMNEPTLEEMAPIGEALRLHPLAIEDVIEPHQRSKVEHYSDHTFVSLRQVTYRDDDITTNEVNLCQGERFLLSVRHGGSPLTPARRHLEADPERAAGGTMAALHSVLDHVVDGYESVAAELEHDVEEVELEVFSDDRSGQSGRIYRLRRETLEFRRAVAPLREPLARFSRMYVPDHAQPYFRDIIDHVQRATDSIDSIEHLLDNALGAHLAQLSLQQNSDMRKLTAGATIFAIPTAVAGVYGMNFEHMPELGWVFGYPLVMGLTALVCLWVFLRFRQSGWL